MKNIHLLPTDKPSRLYEFGGKFILTNELIDAFRNYHIYITSDETTKCEECWHYNNIFNTVSKVQSAGYKKIILTTDPQLIEDGVQAIDDEFLEWFVKNPSCEAVEIKTSGGRYSYDMGGNIWIPISYKIITPKEKPKTNLERLPFPELVKEYAEYYNTVPLVEKPKQETLEEAAEKYGIGIGCDNGTARVDFIEGAKWQVGKILNFIQNEDNHTEGELGNSCIDIQTLTNFIKKYV